MTNLPLHEFIDQNRDELIRRCRAKVAERAVRPTTEADIEHGVPLFLEQLCTELRGGPSKTHEIAQGASEHGHDLWVQGLTISQVVHGYGDVCQAVTDLAVEVGALIDAEDFRTLNRCLDDAIASAVTEYSREQDVTRDGSAGEMRTHLKAALTAFDVIQTGNVGVTGRTASVMLRSLRAIGALIEQQDTGSAVTAAGTTSH